MTNFGYWVAGLGGGRRDVMDAVPGSVARFKSIGGVLLATAAMAAVSSAYAVHVGLQLNYGLSAIAGLCWGFLILTLDRALVQTMAHQKGWISNLVMAAPRVAVALVLGVVISTPLVLRIFDGEIQNEIVTMQLEKVDQNAKDTQANTLYQQIPVLQTKIAALEQLLDTPAIPDVTQDVRVKQAQTAADKAQSAVATAETAMTNPQLVDPATDPRVKAAQAAYDAALKDFNSKQALAQCELNGSCGSHRAGDGDAYRSAKSAQDQAQVVLNKAQVALDTATQTATAALQSAGGTAKTLAAQNLTAAQAQLRTAQATLAAAKAAALSAQTTGAKNTRETAQLQLNTLRPQLQLLVAQKQNADAGFNSTLAHSNGLMNRLEALSRLGATHPTMATEKWLLEILFTLIEILPVLMKVMMNLGTRFAYDDVLEARELVLSHSLKATDSIALDRAKADAAFALERHHDLIEQERRSTASVNQQVVEVQKTIIDNALVAWRGQALAQADAALRGYAPAPSRPFQQYP